MIPTGPVPVRPLPRRKGPMGRWERLLPDGRWMPEADAIAAGIPLTEPLPTMAPSPVVVRHESPEVPPMPATAQPATDPASLPPVALMSPPTARQREAWTAYHAHGGQTAAGRVLGIHQAAVRSALVGYMRAVGMEGPIPPPDPSLVGGPARVPLAADGIVVDARPLGALVDVADPGADHAESIPVAETIDAAGAHVKPMSDAGPTLGMARDELRELLDDAWADGYRRALGDILDAVRSTRGTAYPHQDIIERIARLAIDVPAA